MDEGVNAASLARSLARLVEGLNPWSAFSVRFVGERVMSLLLQ